MLNVPGIEIKLSLKFQTGDNFFQTSKPKADLSVSKVLFLKLPFKDDIPSSSTVLVDFIWTSRTIDLIKL